MDKNETRPIVPGQRMLVEKQALAYTGLGRSSLRKLASEIRAVRHVGRRVLYDKNVLDEYFDRK